MDSLFKFETDIPSCKPQQIMSVTEFKAIDGNPTSPFVIENDYITSSTSTARTDCTSIPDTGTVEGLLKFDFYHAQASKVWIEVEVQALNGFVVEKPINPLCMWIDDGTKKAYGSIPTTVASSGGFTETGSGHCNDITAAVHLWESL